MESSREWRWGAVALCVVVQLVSAANGATITSIVVFGDSLSDTGTVLAATQLSQLTSNPFDVRPANPWYDTGRWTNGTSNDGSNTTAPRTKDTAFGGVWHERLADKLKIDRATSGISNFAFGGATSGMGVFASALLNVGEQIKAFLAGTPTITNSQLFAVWGGGNDLRDAAMMNGATVQSIKDAATTALNNMKANIAALAAKGAKRFLWPNLPPLEKTPEALAMNATQRDGLTQAAEQFRDQQAAAITMLKNNTPGLAIHALDVHGEFLKIVDKPGDFGLTNVTMGVINVTDGKFSDPKFELTAKFPDVQVDADKFLFWDQIHPTAKAHDLIGMQAFKIIIPEPATLPLLAAGFIFFVLPRRTSRQL